jgi:L-threonylcarbamoyladenylate synthase
MALQHSAPSTPGQLKSHYATKTRLLIGDIADLLENNPGLKIGVISFQTNYFSRATENIILSTAGNLEEAAANLFSAMRTLDGFGLDLLVTEIFPDYGIGRAINDRLARAAYRE